VPQNENLPYQEDFVREKVLPLFRPVLDAVDSDYKSVGRRVVRLLLEAADAQRIDRRAVELVTQSILDCSKENLGYGVWEFNRQINEVKMVRSSI
jgi:hypothetical protein